MRKPPPKTLRNERLLSPFPSQKKYFEEYLPRDEVEVDSTNKYITTEILNSVRTSSLPPHRLRLKGGSVAMLLRNLDVSCGMCNGTRLIVNELRRKCILCTFATGSNKEKTSSYCQSTSVKLPFEMDQPPQLSCEAARTANPTSFRDAVIKDLHLAHNRITDVYESVQCRIEVLRAQKRSGLTPTAGASVVHAPHERGQGATPADSPHSPRPEHAQPPPFQNISPQGDSHFNQTLSAREERERKLCTALCTTN
uniref:ATP-dependent DNA helicase n=1 Tax=Caenorhabditis japonica TaxID=281687 RepID=A0A8R1E5V5_CAEJA